MNFFKRFILIFPLPGILMLSSCTISEPDNTLGENGNPESLRLSSITFSGMKLLGIDYDAAGRATRIYIPNEIEYSLQYEGNSLTPSAINTKEWEEYYNNDTDRDEYAVSATDSWTNIKTNSDGYIVSYDYTEVNYQSYWNSETQTDDTYSATTKGHSSISYDSDGHLTSQTYRETDLQTGASIVDSDTYTWSNGLLVATSDGDTFEYSDVENKVLQWDPLNEAFGPLVVTNLFGKAPSKFMSRGRFDGENVQVAYNIFDNGLINLQRRYEDGMSATYKFNYQKK